MRTILRTAMVLLIVGLVGLVTTNDNVTLADEPAVSTWDEATQGPLPRYRIGEQPVLDPDRSLYPYAVTRREIMQAPTSGLMASPPEYSPTKGVLFRYSSYAWAPEVVDCVKELTGDPNHDDIAYVVVSSTAQQNLASSQFQAAGADLSKVEFIIKPTDSIWLRDYGPHFVWQDDTLAIADSHYYPTRPLDNFIPTLLGDDYFQIPTYDMGLYYSGGNFQPGAGRSGFVTALVHSDNPGFGDEFIGELFNMYQGIDTLHIMPQLPYSVDGTGHIDMWMYIVDDDTVIISEFLPGSNPTAIQITNNAVPYMEALGYEVFRTPALNGSNPGGYSHYTYTNAFRVNNRIFIPSYRAGGAAHTARDAEAQAVWEAAAPDCEIIMIDCYDIIWAAGAIHCIVMQVPRYTESMPAAHVVAPDGGELLVSGNTQDLFWSAIDDQEVAAVDLAYSTDGGLSFPYVIAEDEPNDGHFDWTVPDTLTTEGVVKVTVHDDESNSTEALSENTFEIDDAPQTVYDFSTNAGVDRWAWGVQTASWYYIDGNRYPVSSELSPTNYARIAASDATGGDSDTNRYITSYPSSSYESTHVFEFTINEDPATILDLKLMWEGYGDDCTQMEMYVWDHVAGNWCDGAGQSGENRFADNFAGNWDAQLTAHIRENIENVIDADGRLTLLLYAERGGDRSFHDYVAVTVTYQGAVPGDVDGDGIVGVEDLLAVLGAWGACPGCPEDVNGDGVVNIEDLLEVLAAWT